MSLQVWLPLTKDLRQQGISSATAINNGATYLSTGGKLGGCYSFGTGASSLSLPTSTFTSINGDFSVACWVKIISWNTSYATIWAATSTSASWQNIMAGLFRNGSSSKILFCIGNDSSSTQSSCITTEDIQLNTWYHFVCTYTSGKICLYQNGNLVSSYSTSIVPKFSATQYFNIGKMREGTYQTNSSVNDFRIYDHCLSLMEVKELAKGLVLHYPLSDSSIENSQNLCTVLTDGIGTQTWGDHSTVWTIEDATNFPIPVNKCMKAVHTYTNTGTWGGYSRSIQTITASPSTVYTFSCYMKVSDNFEYTSPNFIYHYEYNSSGTKLTEGGLYNKTRMKSVGDGWYRCWGTFTTQNTTTQINISFYSYAEKDTIHWIGGWQIEQKDHMTPFMMPGASRNDSIIYDCSGFCNNGTIIGTFTCLSDTPKYAVSTTINSSKIQCITNPITGDDPIFSIGFWFKLKSNISYIAYADLVSFSSSSYSNQPFRLEICGNPVGNDIYWFRGPSGNTGGFKINTNNLIRDIWYHTVLVSEGNKQYSYYINGIKTGTYNGSDNSWIPTNIFSIGDGQAGAFDISDVRIYATALSADDVKSLYNNSAYIDSSGNIYGAIIRE